MASEPAPIRGPHEPAAHTRDPDPERHVDAQTSPPDYYDETPLDNASRLPAGMATLQVAMQGAEQISVVCRAADDRVPELECTSVGRPEMVLADIARDGGRDASEVRDLIYDWSLDVAEL